MLEIDLNTSLGRCASLEPAEEVAAQLGALADCVVLHPDDLECFRETTRRFQFDLHIRKETDIVESSNGVIDFTWNLRLLVSEVVTVVLLHCV